MAAEEASAGPVLPVPAEPVGGIMLGTYDDLVAGGTAAPPEAGAAAFVVAELGARHSSRQASGLDGPSSATAARTTSPSLFRAAMRASGRRHDPHPLGRVPRLRRHAGGSNCRTQTVELRRFLAPALPPPATARSPGPNPGAEPGARPRRDRSRRSPRTDPARRPAPLSTRS